MNFLDRISKNTQIPNFIKIRPVGAEMLHAVGQTDDMTKLVTLSPLVTGASPRRPMFDVRPVDVGFVMDVVASGQAVLRIL